MSQLESALVGYITGFMAGSLLVFIIIAVIAIRSSEKLERPEEIDNLIDTIKADFMEPEREVFMVAFGIGFIMGIGGSKELVD